MKPVAAIALPCLLGVALCTPAPSRAQSAFWPFRSEAERLVEQAREARERGELRLAESLLEEAQREKSPPMGEVLHERALLERDRGQLEEAVELFEQAAELGPGSSARVDQAGVLVQMGRWPEAVVVLREAFEHHTASLRVEEVLTDKRFLELTGFEPFRRLIEEQRAVQAGPFAKLALKLERIEHSARSVADVIDRIRAISNFLWKLGSSVGAPVIALVLLGLLFASGARQLRVVPAPWTLVLGMTIAALIWHAGSRVASDGEKNGLQVIAWAFGSVFVPYVGFLVARHVWRWRRDVRGRAYGAWSEKHLPETLALVEQLEEAAKSYETANGRDQRRAWHKLRQAERSLKERLSRG